MTLLLRMNRPKRRRTDVVLFAILFILVPTSVQSVKVSRNSNIVIDDDIASSHPGVLEKIWNKLQNQFYTSSRTKNTVNSRRLQSNSNRDRTKSSTKRRRALFEHTIHQHLDLLDREVDYNSSTVNVTALHELESQLADVYLHQSSTEKDYNYNNGAKQQHTHQSLPVFPQSLRLSSLRQIKIMFQHAYDSYMYNAWPHGEVHPISCQPGQFDLIKLPALTLIDSLDTLLIMGNATEFARSVERLRQLHKVSPLFARDKNVSVFETNIRVLGGLLSGHQMAVAYMYQDSDAAALDDFKVALSDVFTPSGDVRWGSDSLYKVSDFVNPLDDNHQEYCDVDVTSVNECKICTSRHQKKCLLNATKDTYISQPLYKYDGFLLELAYDIGNRLYPAFDSRTGIPYGTVNLIYGVPAGETSIASLAGGGTLSLEMELLSRLTGDSRFGKAAKLANRAIWMRRSPLNLLGKHIDVEHSRWTESLSGVGSNSDSYLEYLVKHYMLFPDDHDFWHMITSVYDGIYNENKNGDWYSDVDMSSGRQRPGRQVIESLMAFYPGMQVLLGEIGSAARTTNAFFTAREWLGFLPERFNFGMWAVDSGGGTYPLRPELLESCYFMHRAAKSADNSSGWLWAAEYSVRKIEEVTRVECGYATLRDVDTQTTGSIDGSYNNVRHVDDMPSFFLSETLKYLYLIFDEDNMLHSDIDRDWVFTTEAHPIHSVEAPTTPDLAHSHRRLKHTLRSALRKKKVHKPNIDTHKSQLDKEKWSTKTSQDAYEEQLSSSASMTYLMHESLTDSWDDITSEDRMYIATGFDDEFNIKHLPAASSSLTYRPDGSGRGYNLIKSCWNPYTSDRSWIDALNGGELDYTENFHSTLSNGHSDFSSFFSLSAAEALSYLRSGKAPWQMEQDTKQGNFRSNNDHDGDSTDEAETNEQASLGSNARVTSNSNSATLQTSIGTFNVKSFPRGAGFMARHRESGEYFETTLLQDNYDASNQFVMIRVSSKSSHVPSNTEDEHVSDNGSAEAEQSTQGLPKMDKQLFMSDAYGHSFQCQVELFAQTLMLDEPITVLSESESLIKFPCAPALFGDTHLSKLAKLGQLIYHAPIVGPTADVDYFGCFQNNSRDGVPYSDNTCDSKGARDHENCASNDIQIVHRGDCTFYEKVLNQKTTKNAGGVIVVNTDDDELFVMSNDPELEDATDLSPDIPVSVLVTGNDGSTLLNTISQYSSNTDAYITAKISLMPIKPNIYPLISVSKESITLITASGWGVQAEKKSNNWDLRILQIA